MNFFVYYTVVKHVKSFFLDFVGGLASPVTSVLFVRSAV